MPDSFVKTELCGRSRSATNFFQQFRGSSMKSSGLVLAHLDIFQGQSPLQTPFHILSSLPSPLLKLEYHYCQFHCHPWHTNFPDTTWTYAGKVNLIRSCWTISNIHSCFDVVEIILWSTSAYLDTPPSLPQSKSLLFRDSPKEREHSIPCKNELINPAWQNLPQKPSHVASSYQYFHLISRNSSSWWEKVS